METIEATLARWRASLLPSVPVAGLFSRNPIVYKWKAPFRVWLLREATFWRIHDLLSQSYALHELGHGLGARIILRSGFETLSTLIYLNQTMQQVMDGILDFSAFSEKTTVLLLGSRNDKNGPTSLNIVGVLQKCDRKYPGLNSLYAELSESAHPSFEGLLKGYSKVDHDEFETMFSNRWTELYGQHHLGTMSICLKTFEHEYDEVWPDLICKLEGWIEANDARIEAMKGDLSPERIEAGASAESTSKE